MKTVLVGEIEVEHLWFEPAAGACAARQPIVLLHHAFGCVADWRDFPQVLADASGRRVLAYSRQGSGSSSLLTSPRDTRYLHEEGKALLPRLLDVLAIASVYVFGHSDGATIALLFAGSYPERTRGCVIEAPHVFVEDLTLRGVKEAKARYEADADYRARIARYHRDPEGVFRSWWQTWLSPEFASWSIVDDLRAIKVPLLVIQGDQDAYGTYAHAEAIAANARGPVHVEGLAGHGHVPHAENPHFIARLAAEFFDTAERWECSQS